MAGLSSLIFGQDSPQAQYVDANQGWLGALAYGLGSKGNLADKLGTAVQAIPAGKVQETPSVSSPPPPSSSTACGSASSSPT